MGTERRRAVITAATYAGLVIVMLIAGGIYVRTLVAQSFRTSAEIGSTRALAFQSLKLMLDEETGLRGYAATGRQIFLEPYHAAVVPFDDTMTQLRGAVAQFGIPVANRAVTDIAADHALYLRNVAAALLGGPGHDTLSAEVQGKTLVDRFRLDVAVIDSALAERDAGVNNDVRTAIDRIGLLTGGAVFLVLLISVVYGIRQAALANRVDEERARAAAQEYEAGVLRAAYVTEKRIADTLQEAFVQRPLPAHPTLRFSATYVPASEEAKVGGDWYDALELPGNRVLFAIGDVTGHGIEAAVTMNRVRQTLISSALLDATPAALLQRVARELYAGKTPLVTAVAGYADASTYEFVYATAGHPPPLLMEPGRPPRMLDCGSLPLGAIANNEYRTFRVQSVPGATLVLYTDGAVEHSRDVLEGEQILLEAAAEAARVGPPDPATFIHKTVFNGREVGDDVAILTIGFAAEPAVGVRVSADRAQAAFSGRLAGGPASTAPAPPQARWLRSIWGKKAA